MRGLKTRREREKRQSVGEGSLAGFAAALAGLGEPADSPVSKPQMSHQQPEKAKKAGEERSPEANA